MRLLLYLTGLLVLGSGIYFVRKSEEKQNAVIYLAFTAVLVMIVQTVEAGIISRISGISVSAGVFGLLHVIEGSVLWFFILVKKYRQEYYFEPVDAATLAILAVFVAIVAVRQFGVRLDNFNFQADSDGARHYMFARAVSDRGALTSLFFSSLNSGLLMNALRGIVGRFSFYRVFILFEVWVLFLNGAIFWAVIRRYLNDRFSIAVGIVAAVAYMLGYPWNSMVFGTSYLSTGIMCVTMIIFLMDAFYNDVFHLRREVLFLLFLSCYALLCSYSLFVPPVMGGIFLLILFKGVKEKKLSSHRAHIIIAITFVFCLFMGSLFVYMWVAKGMVLGQMQGLSLWGLIYGALYTDFLFVMPFCILWFRKTIQSKKVNIECTIMPVFVLYAFVFLMLLYWGKVSAYYYYKTYYILWIVALMMVTRAIIDLKQERPFVLSYIFTWAMLFLVFISSVEMRLPKEFNLDLIEPSGGRMASDYFGLYNYNIKYSRENKIERSKKDLYMEAARLSEEAGEFIPYIGKYLDNEWTYFALAGKEHVNVLEGKKYEAAVRELQKYSYILSVECEEPTIKVNKFLEDLPVIYENESGKIYQMDSSRISEESLVADIDIDIVSRYGLPKLERMGWIEQDDYVNSLQVIRRIDKLGLNKEDFLYPERETERIMEGVSHLADGHYQNRKEIIFTGTTSQELQQVIDDNPGALIEIRSEQIDLNEAIKLQNNTAVNGNGVKITGDGLEYGFVGERVSDIYLSDIIIEGNLDYGIYLTGCNEISISGCVISGLSQKAICVTSDTRGVSIKGNQICNNCAGGISIAGNVSECLIEDNSIIDNGGTSKWMSGIVLSGAALRDEDGIEYDVLQRAAIYDQMDCPHDFIVKNNSISGNKALGIYSEGAYKGYVTENTIGQNAYGGISLEYGTMGFYLEGNHVESSGEVDCPGIALDNTAYNIIKNNIITNNQVGIKMVQTSVRNLIIENTVCGGENDVFCQYAVEVGAGTGTDEDKNIDVSPGYENIICRNSISGNHYSGVFIDEGCYINDVFDNEITGVQDYSVEAVSHMFNSIINNISESGVRNEY